MKKNIGLVFLLYFFLLFSFNINAQSIRLGLGGGLTSITSPSYYTDNISNGAYGFKGNYHLSLIAKLNLPLLPITPAFFIDYHYLNSSGQFDSVEVSYSQRIFSIGVEGEWDFLPLPIVKPYLLVNVALNNFGELKATTSNEIFGQSSFTRYGAGVGLGTVLSVIPSMDLDLSAKYNFMNLVGKKSGEGAINSFTLNLVILF
jgi:Outer membrane protein beta-barrel domain